MSEGLTVSKIKSYLFAILTFGWLLNLIFSRSDDAEERISEPKCIDTTKMDYVFVFKYSNEKNYHWTEEIRNYLKEYLTNVGIVIEEKIIVQVKRDKNIVNLELENTHENPFKSFCAEKIEKVFLFYLLEPTAMLLEKEIKHNAHLTRKKSSKKLDEEIKQEVDELNSSERQRFIYSVLNRKVIAQKEDQIFFDAFNAKIKKYNENLKEGKAINEDRISKKYLKNIDFYLSERILPKLTHLKYVDSIYPTHNEAEKTNLFKEYSSGFYHQPLEGMRTYFGEKIGFYFAWLNIYTRALFIPSAIICLIYLLHEIAYLTEYNGFLIEVTNNYLTIFYCIFLCLWSTIFLEVWKRRSAVLAWKWGVNGYEEHEEQRPQFIGKVVNHPYRVGCQYKEYPSYKRYLKIFTVSLPVMLATLTFSAFLMVLCFQIEDYIILNFEPDSYFHYIPLVLICLEIFVMNLIYSKFAVRLNDWENFETESEYNKHFIWKRILFEYLNAYASFYYIAFYKQDMERLQTQLIGVFVTRQIFQNIFESLVPWLQIKFKEKILSSKRGGQCTVADALIDEFELPPYDDTYDDYAEMVMQYGYLLQFSAAFPLAALFSVFNNIIELRSDAFKLIFTQRRSNSKMIDGIGIWQSILEFISVLSVVTNCCLLLFTTNQLDMIFSFYHAQFDFSWKLFAVIFLEHFILIFRWLLSEVIPDVPNYIKVQITKEQYEERLKLKDMKYRLKQFSLGDAKAKKE